MNNYSQTGSYVAVVGLVVTLLSHFGVLASADQIGAVVGGAVALWGIVQQFLSHKKLAQATGSYPQ